MSGTDTGQDISNPFSSENNHETTTSSAPGIFIASYMIFVEIMHIKCRFLKSGRNH